MTLWVALVILVGFSAFFSASETAFSSLNQIRLKSRAEDGDSSAARVLNMAEQYDKLLSTILIGNNIVNIAAASIGTILFTRMLGAERGATVSTIVLTIIVLIFGEVTPKSLAKTSGHHGSDAGGHAAVLPRCRLRGVQRRTVRLPV